MEAPVVKSPLSIIALFVALIELFLAYPVTQLSGAERLIVVIFMTLFPFYVASLFFYVLWHKPIHLYSPQDITPGLENRYQAEAGVEVTALEIHVRELELQNQRLRQRMTNAEAAAFAPGGDSRLVPKEAQSIASDFRTLEEEIRKRVQESGSADEATLQRVKHEVERSRRENVRQTQHRVSVEMAGFRAWLEGCGFASLPPIPDVVIEPAGYLNTYYNPADDTAHIGSLVSHDKDTLAHTYMTCVLQGVAPPSIKDETDALLMGIADYYACAFNGDPYLGEDFAAVAGLETGWIRNLEQVVNYRGLSDDLYTLSLVWSGACWALRDSFDTATLNRAIRVTLSKVGRDSSIRDAAIILALELARSEGEEAKDAVSRVFAQRGITLVFETAVEPHRQIQQTAAPALAIPDNDPGGLSHGIVIDEDGVLQNITVHLDISHTYVGDLRVKLISPSGAEILLHDRTGASADDLREDFDMVKIPELRNLVENEEHARGTWTLVVSDLASLDTGSLNAWGLTLAVV
jgi:subtilisin-like proprotein convertase family protein